MKNTVDMKQKKTVCKTNECAGCMACMEVCPSNAIKIQDSLNAYNAVIDSEKCIECNLCHKVCQNNNDYSPIYPQIWYQGWAKDEGIRMKSSSGGIAAALSYAFVENGGIVCSCTFLNGEFRFSFAKTTEEVKGFAGSKYVKSNPYGIYKELKKMLKSGISVLFIGLPCQVQAIYLYVGDLLQENLYTIDLICHGTPSPKLLQDFLLQYHMKLKDIENISFRSKDRFGLKNNSYFIAQRGTVDRYSLAFLCSLNYTENCYSCRYADIKRGSDLTIGDSWGTELSKEEQKKGISLILCQTDKGKKLLQMGNLSLFNVDLNKAIACNAQLRGPSEKIKRHNRFFKLYKNKHFNRTVFFCLPEKCCRQIVKAVLLKLKIIKGGVKYMIIISKKSKANYLFEVDRKK